MPIPGTPLIPPFTRHWRIDGAAPRSEAAVTKWLSLYSQPGKSSASIHVMKRQLIALVAMLAIGLQGSLVAFAGIAPLMSTDCQTAVSSYTDASQDSCCPKGQHSMGCCLEACTGTIAGAVTVMPQVLNCFGSTALLPQFRTTHFSSRGNSPLIRPPIL
jgi:hypothetical protein